MLVSLLTLLMASSPNIGDIAPDFTAKDLDGVELNLGTLAEKGPVVVAFFPKAFTPG